MMKKKTLSVRKNKKVFSALSLQDDYLVIKKNPVILLLSLKLQSEPEAHSVYVCGWVNIFISQQMEKQESNNLLHITLYKHLYDLLYKCVSQLRVRRKML